MAEHNSCPIWLSRSEVEKYYHGFSNKTIWPLFHYFTQYTEYDNHSWEVYEKVNRHFFDVITQHIKPGDTIWIHDYHLLLLPQMIREAYPDARIGYFLHIPFPSFELFRLLPWRKEILNGILGADVIGFHTYDYVRHFLSSVHRVLGIETKYSMLMVNDRTVQVDAFPLGIDFDGFNNSNKLPEVKREINRIAKRANGKKIILSVDRQDYTKGIVERLIAYKLFLEKNPQYRAKVILVFIAVPTRTKVEAYVQLNRQVNELIGNINGKYGTIDWQPIWYINRAVPYKTLMALYNMSDIALVTPLRDGMNLVAKEYLAAKSDLKGVLIISEMAGVAQELGEAIIVNPNNTIEIIDAIKRALTMPEKEQKRNNEIMRKRLQRYDVMRWVEDFMDRLDQTKNIQKSMYVKLSEEKKKELLKDYKSSKKRLIFLDYDGTLMPFQDKPSNVKPDQEILSLIKQLTDSERNEVVIISGRKKENLLKWLGKLPLNFVAEHGVWLKELNSDWEMIEQINTDWKIEILPILQLYVDRTPGSFIEEKEYSLVWHFRRVDSEFGVMRIRELVDDLTNYVQTFNLDVLEGNKVIEIKNNGINKGRAAAQWINKVQPDFIFAAGDDWTDEDLFRALPDNAYSVKVGLGATQAKYNVHSTKNVRELLRDLISCD